MLTILYVNRGKVLLYDHNTQVIIALGNDQVPNSV